MPLVSVEKPSTASSPSIPSSKRPRHFFLAAKGHMRRPGACPNLPQVFAHLPSYQGYLLLHAPKHKWSEFNDWKACVSMPSLFGAQLATCHVCKNSWKYTEEHPGYPPKHKIEKFTLFYKTKLVSPDPLRYPLLQERVFLLCYQQVRLSGSHAAY